MQVPLPIVISREGKWFVAACPVLNIATQGETEEEVKAMMIDLVQEYLRDPHTIKPKFESIISISLTNIFVDIPEDVLNRKASPASAF